MGFSFYLIFLTISATIIGAQKEAEKFSFGGFRPPGGIIRRLNSSDVNMKIVGGSIAVPGSHPYQISLQILDKSVWKGFHICGGSILSPTVIACAAHCCEEEKGLPMNPSDLRVIAGAHDLRFAEPSQQVARVERLTIHPKYKSFSTGNDACRIILKTPLTLNSRVAKIDICSSDLLLPPNSKHCSGISSGWGDTYDDGNLSPVLKELHMNIVSRSKCKKAYGRRVKITDTMLCTGGLEDESACNGDSGGPFVCMTSGSKCLAGAASWVADPCGSEGYPTVFTNVAYLKEFYDDSENMPSTTDTPDQISSKKPEDVSIATTAPSIHQTSGQNTPTTSKIPQDVSNATTAPSIHQTSNQNTPATSKIPQDVSNATTAPSIHQTSNQNTPATSKIPQDVSNATTAPSIHQTSNQNTPATSKIPQVVSNATTAPSIHQTSGQNTQKMDAIQVIFGSFLTVAVICLNLFQVD